MDKSGVALLESAFLMRISANKWILAIRIDLAHYPNLFHLKLMGTHAKYWICDRKVAYVGSHNVLSSNTSYLDLAGEEVGTLHTSPRNIQKLINCFETQPDLSR